MGTDRSLWYAILGPPQLVVAPGAVMTRKEFSISKLIEKLVRSRGRVGFLNQLSVQVAIVARHPPASVRFRNQEDGRPPRGFAGAYCSAQQHVSQILCSSSRLIRGQPIGFSAQRLVSIRWVDEV